MKKSPFILFVIIIFFVSCGNSGEIENLKKENAALVEQVNALKSGTNAKAPKYILKLHLQQSHLSLSIKKTYQRCDECH